MKLSKKPTGREVLYSVARMGGHLPNNGPPGWPTIRRGLDDLDALDQALQMLGLPRCDQSRGWSAAFRPLAAAGG